MAADIPFITAIFCDYYWPYYLCAKIYELIILKFSIFLYFCRNYLTEWLIKKRY